jgi:hypothetical protein
MNISALQNKPVFNMRNYMNTSVILRAVCEDNVKLTVLNMRLDDQAERALPVIDLKTKLKISPSK